MSTVFIEKELNDHIKYVNNTGADLAQYEFAVVGPFCGVADNAIASTEEGYFHVQEGLHIQVGSDYMKAAELTFATLGQAVYFDAANKKFSDTSTAGYYKVGVLVQTKASDGHIIFEKKRYVEVVPEPAE